MSISIIRKYDDEDKARVLASAKRFCDRHNIWYSDFYGVAEIEADIDHWIYDSHPEVKAYHRKLWTACYCRALRVPCDVRTTTGYGYIGVRVYP